MAGEERVVDLFVVAAKPHDDAQAELVFAYPDADSESTREFSESVTMFMFPHGFGKDWDKRALPPPPAHNLFALTDASGEHLYGASLCFYETLLPSADAHADAVGVREDNNSGGGVQYQAKAICLLGKRPFYTQLLRYLEQLFLLGTRQSRANGERVAAAAPAGERWFGIERTLCNLFHEVPVPHRGLAVLISIADVEIVLERPLLQEFPFEMDAELMTYAFMMIEPRVMLQLYHHVLLEHRLLIVCADSVLATAIAEAVKCLAFPLTWLHVYIPNIPDSLDLSTLLEAPVPFIAGAHTRQLDNVEIPPNVVKLEFAAGKFVFGSASSSEIALPALPEVSQRVASKLGTMRLPDFASQKREFHEKIWNRRLQLQKMCMSSSSSSPSLGAGGGDSALSKALFLARPNALYRKAMKLYLEIMATLLAEYPAFVSNDGNQTGFDAERFVERKPAGERVFYREFVGTALFQSFLAQHNDHMSGSLAHDDAVKLQFVHRRMLSDGEDARGSFAVPPASKTFVAHAPQLPPLPSSKRKKSFVLPPRLSFTSSSSSVARGSRRTSQSVSGTPPPPPPTASMLDLECVNVSICFPEIDTRAFGCPRPIVFPTLANDAKTSSLGTFLSASKSKRAPSKELGIEWMQQLMKNVSMPSVPFKKPDFLVASSSSSPPERHAAAFKRSRTFDRIGRSPLTSSSVTSSSAATPFYRTMTQRALGSSAGIFRDTDGGLHHARQQETSTRAAPVVKSIWLVTTSACACKKRVVELTECLARVLEQHERNSSHASDAYCQLIDCLGSCGHPSEAKAVFEECLSGSHLLSLEGVASHKHFWKPFSSLMRCYIANGLVQRAFDVLVQVKIEEEQCLDPSLGSLCFGAQVLSSESEVLVERIYATFSCGNMGIYLAARDSGVGAEVIAFETPTPEQVSDSTASAGSGAGAAPSAACCVKEYDVVETINGEVVLQSPLQRVVQCLKQAYRPMTITFLRGLPKLESLVTEQGDSDLSSNNNSSSSSGGVGAGGESDTKFRPRKDLCDRFGLLPQRGIRLTTLADCTNCGTRASLPEIQDGWSKSDANDYTTRCATCGHRYVPRLCAMLGVATAFYQPAPGSEPVRVEQFEYLSMLVIRKELTNLAQKLPLTMLSMSELRDVSPRIYWNIVVKLLSLACPLDFLDLPDTTAPDARRVGGGAADAQVSTSERAGSAAAPASASEEQSKGAAVLAGREAECSLESSEMRELQAHFMRTMCAIQARESCSSSATVSRMLHELERHARPALLGECDDAEEDDDRRSCRTASLADSGADSVDTAESEMSGAKPSRVSGLAPFQRKARASKLARCSTTRLRRAATAEQAHCFNRLLEMAPQDNASAITDALAGLRDEVRFDRLVAARRQFAQRITASDAPMRWLPTLVQRWRELLALSSRPTAPEPPEASREALALEHLALAQTLRSMGEIAGARESLGRCIALARRHLESDTAVRVVGDATRELTTCIELQESLTTCRTLLQRTKSPPQVTAFLVRELAALSVIAPFSLEVVTLRAELQWVARQFAPLVQSLSESTLTASSARLTLLLARALDALGEYRQSLDVIARGGSEGGASPTGDPDTHASAHALLALGQRLTALLDSKREAEQLLRESRSEDAEQRFSRCLALLGDHHGHGSDSHGSDSHGRNTFRAQLLFGRASATLLALESLPPAAADLARAKRFAAAIDDLSRGLELDASDRLAKLRLDTVTMQLATETLRAKLVPHGGA